MHAKRYQHRAEKAEAKVERLQEALRQVHGDVAHAIAEHALDPRRSAYEEGDFDRRLMTMQKAVQKCVHWALGISNGR